MPGLTEAMAFTDSYLAESRVERGEAGRVDRKEEGGG